MGEIIQTIGDSHAQFTFANVPGVKTNWIGPVTMHRVGRDGIDTGLLDFTKHTIFCFGEIDVRCHIWNQSQTRDEDEVIETLVNRYLKFVSGVPNAVLMSVVPPVRANHSRSNPDFPFTGTDDERSRYCNKINRLLKHAGLPYLDIFSRYADSQGMLPEIYADESVHLSDTKFVQEELNFLRGQLKIDW